MISGCTIEPNVPNWAIRRWSTLPFPDFMTSANRELMLSAVFFAFFVGAIVALKEAVEIPVVVEALRTVRGCFSACA